MHQSAPEKKKMRFYGNPLGRGERWVRFDVNALSLARSLSLSISLSLSLRALSFRATLRTGRKIGAFWCKRALSLSLFLSLALSLALSLSSLSLSRLLLNGNP